MTDRQVVERRTVVTEPPPRGPNPLVATLIGLIAVVGIVLILLAVVNDDDGSPDVDAPSVQLDEPDIDVDVPDVDVDVPDVDVPDVDVDVEEDTSPDN